ncbi:MAG TPA: peptide-binding protein [bacterium]|nr:peptide-binding protein [bacterium]
MKAVRPITILCLLLILFFSCGKKEKDQAASTSIGETRFSADKPEYGGTLVRALSGEPVSLQPLYGYSDGASCEVIIHLFPPLVRKLEDPDRPGFPKLTPVLAESWSFSPDGRELEFKLRENVHWEDGVEVTTEDVIFTYQKAIDHTTKTIVHYAFSRIDTVLALDKYRFKVFYNQPYVYAVFRWDIGLLPKHILTGKDINTNEFNRRPVGYGMFKFVNWASNEQIIIEANENSYWGRPYLDRMIFRIIPESAVQILELKAGNLDLVTRLHTTQFVRDLVGPEVEQNINKYEYEDTFMYGLVFNLKVDLFQDKRIRQAIYHAIDKQSIIQGVQLGKGRPGWGPIPPESWAHNSNIKKYPHDPQQALELLASAGWKDHNGDGFLDQDGKNFEFTALSFQNESVQQIVTIIQQQLKKVGIKMKIKVVEWSVYLNSFVAKRNFDVCVTRGGQGVMDPDLVFTFHSSQIHDTEYNWASYINPTVDTLIEKSLTTFDVDKRKQYFFKAQQIIAEDVPVIYLYLRNSMLAVNKRVQGVRPLPSPLGFDHNLDYWWIPKIYQRQKKY